MGTRNVILLFESASLPPPNLLIEAIDIGIFQAKYQSASFHFNWTSATL
jgi:hypothetical protein